MAFLASLFHLNVSLKREKTAVTEVSLEKKCFRALLFMSGLTTMHASNKYTIGKKTACLVCLFFNIM